MSPRRSGPVLLELVRNSPRPSAGPADASAPSEGGGGGSMLNWAGRTIRVPAGYIFVVAAVIIAAGIFGYVIGFGRAERVAQHAAAQEKAQLSVTDPLDSGPPTLNLTPRHEGPRIESALPTAASREGVSGAEEASEETPDDAPTVGGETRVEGLNYYVLVRDLPAEGDRLVAWLDSRGIPAMTEAVSGGLVKVIVLDGFERGQASSARALSFKQHLRELGSRWKRDHKGSSDFSDLYLEKFRG